MFTGIVQTKAQVKTLVQKKNFIRLTLWVADKHLNHLETGASIAINGCCLTVTNFQTNVTLKPDNHSDSHTSYGTVSFDVIDETLRLTNLAFLKVEDEVNFERSLTLKDELGGHVLSGHIQTLGTLSQRIDTDLNCALYIELDTKWMPYVLPKGFISVNGTSLTIGKTTESGFWLHLIPETLERTTFGGLKVGDKLNIEIDQQTFTIVETVKKVLSNMQIEPN